MTITRRSREAARSRVARTRQPVRLGIPSKGLYARHPGSKVNNTLAHQLDNYFGDGVVLTLRPGFARASRPIGGVIASWAYEFGAEPKSVYQSATEITDGAVTMRGAYPKPFAMASLSSRLVFAGNGVRPIIYDGLGVETARLASPGPSTVEQFDGVIAHHDRLFFWNRSETRAIFYYGAGVGAIEGDLLVFDLSTLGNIKGAIASMLSMTTSAGDGPNNVLVIFTTAGQIVVYEGRDPQDPTDWRLAWRAQTDAPISDGTMLQYGTDILTLTANGIVSVQGLLAGSIEALGNPISEPVNSEIRAAIHAAAPGADWQLIKSPDAEFLLLNYPTADGPRQLVWGLDARGWFRWTIPAMRWWQHAPSKSLQFVTASGDVFQLGQRSGRGEWSVRLDDGAPMTAEWHSSWMDVSSGAERAIKAMLIEASVWFGAKHNPIAVEVCALTNGRDHLNQIEDHTHLVLIDRQDPETNHEHFVDEETSLDQWGRTLQLRTKISAEALTWRGTQLLL